MYVSKVRNVCEALPASVNLIMNEGVLQESRAGFVLVLPAPLMTVTSHPCERVLRSAARDANPFFHMVEAIWMLAGRNDAATLNRYVKDFGDRFAERQLGDPLPEGDGRIHDAYGRRWRIAFQFDQLDAVVKRLIENPNDRQCVIAMWDATLDGENDLNGAWLTRPCNTHLYLRVQEDNLDMTVCCRSNDMVWGGHGANAVHFSVLQEYLAARIDVGIGTMYQLSNNAHAYSIELERLTKRMLKFDLTLEDDPYTNAGIKPEPMFTDPTEIDNDIAAALQWHDGGKIPDFTNDWFGTTFASAIVAHRIYRTAGDINTAIKVAGTIKSDDWRFACVEWLQRRIK
jgi:hypothetical protein